VLVLRCYCCWCRCEEHLAAQEKATAVAEAAAAKATAKAETAADALAAKEQQLAEWRQLAQASKETASQQLQLSQVCTRQLPLWYNHCLLND
jgi:CelD/BcsL family acetyltransferase involved in cellulose biosynthesis